MSLTLVQARNDLLSKLGIEDATEASDLALQDVVVAINGAMQMLQTAGQDFFTKEKITLTLSAGTALYNIASSIQAVVGPVRWNDIKTLRALGSQGELDQFARTFLGESEFGSGDDGDPIAYWVDYQRTGDIGDVCAVTIQLCPAPTAPAGTLVIEAINDAPAYTVADLTSSTALPVAQNYTESIFLPIARMLVTRSSQFSRPDLLTQLTQDAGVAMQRLGLSGGFPNVKQPAPERTVEA
jgi:hypothetical protein